MKKLLLLSFLFFHSILFGEISVTPFGAAGTVSGSSFLVEYNNASAIVDCGLFYDSDGDNFEIPQKLLSAKTLILTHCHLDHIGRVPLLFQSGFSGRIYSTAATKKFSLDSFRSGAGFNLIKKRWVYEKNYKKNGNKVHWEKKCIENLKGIVESPQELDLDAFKKKIGANFSLCKICLNISVDKIETLFGESSAQYGQIVKISDKFSFKFINAAHVPGSASVLFEAGGKKILFSGDLGSSYSKLTGKPPVAPKADFVFVEVTNGVSENSIDEGQPYRSFREDLKNAIDGGKIVWINALAFNRTQKVLYEIKDMQDSGEISKSVPVYSASYGANRISRIYEREAAENKNNWFLTEIYIKKSILPKNLIFKEPKDFSMPLIFLSASGDEKMSGRFIEKFAKSRNVLIMSVNYLSPGNSIEALHSGKDKRFKDIEAKKYPVFSDHPNLENLLKWLSYQDGSSKIYAVHYEKNEIAGIKQFFNKSNISINETIFGQKVLIEK